MSTPRLLVIDHDVTVQQTIETAFAEQGFEITAVGDGLTALDVALATRPDVILADYRMDGTNIFRFFEKLRQKNVLKETALLLLVNPGDVYDELTLRLVGVADFIRKPLSVKETIDRVKRYLPAQTPTAVVAPAPSSSAHAPTPGEPDTMKIEDLLGWPHPSGESPFSELSQERSGGLDLGGPVSAPLLEPVDDTTQFLEHNELTPPDQFGEATVFAGAPTDVGLSAPEGSEPSLTKSTTAPAPPLQPPEVRVPIATGNGAAVSPDTVDRITRDIVEKVAWDIVPGLAQQSLEQVVKAVVERIVWETVPAIAETAIKQEIDRLKAES